MAASNEASLPHVLGEQPSGKRPLGGRRGCCRIVEWLQETRTIAVGGDDGMIRLYNEGGREYATVHTNHDRIFGVREAGGDTIVSIGLDGWIRAWDVSDDVYELDATTTPDKKSCTALFVQNSTRVLVGTENGGLVLYKWNGRRFCLYRHSIHAHSSQIEDIHAYEGIMAAASRDQRVSIWNPENLTRLRDLHFHHRVYSVQVNSKYIAIGAKDLIRLYKNIAPDFTFHMDVRVNCGFLRRMAFIQNHLFLAAGEVELCLIRVNGDAQILNRFETAAKYIQDITFLPSGEVAVCGVGKDANSIFKLSKECNTLIKQSMKSSRNSAWPQVGLNNGQGRKTTRFSQLHATNTSRGQHQTMPTLASSEEHDCSSQNSLEAVHMKQKQLGQRLLETSTHPSAKNAQAINEFPFDNNSNADGSCDSEDNVAHYMSSTEMSSYGLLGHFEPHFLSFVELPAIDEQIKSESTNSEIDHLLRESIEKMENWLSKDLSEEDVRSLDINDISELMAASIVWYPAWASLLKPFIAWIKKFFQSNRLNTEDVFGAQAISTKTVLQKLSKAMDDDENIGMRLGAFNRAKQFIEKYRVRAIDD